MGIFSAIRDFFAIPEESTPVKEMYVDPIVPVPEPSVGEFIPPVVAEPVHVRIKKRIKKVLPVKRSHHKKTK